MDGKQSQTRMEKLCRIKRKRQQEQNIPVSDHNASEARDQTLDSDGSDETNLYRSEEKESEGTSCNQARALFENVHRD